MEECVRLLPKLEPAQENPPVDRPRGQSPLHLAARDGRFSAVKSCLVATGAHVGLRNIYGNNSELDLASVNGHVEVMREIIERGANVDFTDVSGATALHKAAAKARCGRDPHARVGRGRRQHRIKLCVDAPPSGDHPRRLFGCGRSPLASWEALSDRIISNDRIAAEGRILPPSTAHGPTRPPTLWRLEWAESVNMIQ